MRAPLIKTFICIPLLSCLLGAQAPGHAAQPRSMGAALESLAGTCLERLCIGMTVEEIQKLGALRWEQGEPTGRVACKQDAVVHADLVRRGTRYQLNFALGYTSGPVLKRYRVQLVSLLLPDATDRTAEEELSLLAKRNGIAYQPRQWAAFRHNTDGLTSVTAQIVSTKDYYKLLIGGIYLGEKDWLNSLSECR